MGRGIKRLRLDYLATPYDFSSLLGIRFPLPFLRVERRMNREKKSGWHHTGNNLSAMAAIDAEVGISGKQERIGQCFGHTHKAGVGEAHGQVGVFLQQPQHGFRVVVKIEIHEHGTALKQSAERRGSTSTEKVEGFGQDGFASAPGWSMLSRLGYRPRVMRIAAAEQSH